MCVTGSGGKPAAVMAASIVETMAGKRGVSHY